MKSFWHHDEQCILTQMFANNPTVVICKMLGRTYSSVSQHARILGLSKSHEFLKSHQSGRLSKLMKKGYEYRFPKGSSPWNKGKHFNAGGRSAETQFKKGEYRPAKEFYLHKDKNGKYYKHVRVAPGKRMPLHRVNWERANGSIPKRFIVCFKDGDTLNCELSNLFLLSKADNMNRNSIQRFPAELKTTMKVLSKFKRKIKSYEEQN
jgi:hypothetical protein